MNSVERVKAICKERGIAISKLEKACGFSNGYISQLKKGVFPTDRIKKISEYLELSVEYLMTGEESESGYYLDSDTARMAQEMYEDPDMRTLFDMKRNMPADRFAAHVKFMKELYEKENPSD